MDDAKKKRTLRSARLFYLAIDGTRAVDSAVFGGLLEKHRGWRNLATAHLDPAPDEPGRLVDPAHPFLPIHKVAAEGRRIAVVCPAGREAHGTDLFWKHYNDTKNYGGSYIASGRQAAAEESAKYMFQLILRPSIHFSREPRGLVAHFFDQDRQNAAKAAPAADLLYVSSHGWLGGFMRGDNPLPAFAGATPPEAADPYSVYYPYFAVGLVAARGVGFHGPKWIVLAQCSTANNTTWSLWAKVLAASSPGVRGILAYGEASPAPEGAALVARRFFRALDQGTSFLRAWRRSNGGRKWTAIVHREATDDTLAGFRSVWPLSSVATTSSKASYRGYSSESPEGADILDVPEPFSLTLEQDREGRLRAILPENVHETGLEANGRYRITITAPAGEMIERVRIALIHIRPNYKPSFRWSQVFVGLSQPRNIDIKGHSTDTLDIRVVSPGPSISFDLQAADDIARLGIAVGHSYFWFRVELRTDSGSRNYDFKTKGLLY